MKKLKLSALTLLLNTSFIFAGGILTNTNQSVHFLRNPARDASLSIDGVYTNPAGLIKLAPGFHFSFTNQSAFQTRTIKTTFAPFALDGGSETKKFKGTASAPIVPSFMGVYRVGDWALSGSIAVTGGGGKATFNEGLPSFESAISMIPVLLNSNGVLTDRYSVDAYMKGSSFIFGGQLGGTYEINEMLSAYAGFRLNIVKNGYEGHLRNIQVNPLHALINPTGNMMLATDFFSSAAGIANGTADLLNPFIVSGNGDKTVGQLIGAGLLTQEMANQLGAGLGNPDNFNNMPIGNVRTAYVTMAEGYTANANNTKDKYLDCSQSGWGVAPILGLNFNYNNLNIGVKYEFRTKLNVENKTKVDDTGLFRDGVNTPHDIPALLTIGVSYKFIPSLTVSAGYHHFFDSDAKMDGDKQKHIKGGTNEYLGGIEYEINRLFLVSGGFQITRYGVQDGYQKDLSYAVNSYSIGLGGAVNVSPKVKINIGYFWTNYSDYTKNSADYMGTGQPGKDVFSRTNKVFGAGVDFSF